MKVLPALLCVVLFLASCTSDASGGDDDAVSVVSDGDSELDETAGAESDADSGVETDQDNDDAAEIIGNEDLDLEELAEVAPDVAEALDEIDDLVSIGDCQSQVVGLAVGDVPDGWVCRVLDAPVAGLDGFTLFKSGNPGGLEITVGTPSPFGRPCEMLQACDGVEAIDLGANFDTEIFEMAGVPFIFGTHKTIEAEVSVTSASALSDDDIEFITMVLDGLVEL
ncbi:MAG: hypothetical protein ACRBK7_13785 [Acidimicrobiales bacterium]